MNAKMTNNRTNAIAAMEMPDAFRTDTGDVATGQPLEIDLHPYAICRIDG